jgi:hypothetical protein
MTTKRAARRSVAAGNRFNERMVRQSEQNHEP